MKRLLTILCLLIPFLGVKAGTLKGKIIDQDAQPVAGAVITYYSYSDNSILATTTSDVNGNWELSYEEAWNDIQIVARAEGYTSYTLHDCNVSMNHTWPKIIFRLSNAIDYKAGKRSTIYLPEAPDVSWGRFYRLDHEDGNKVVFEREHTPKAYVPYVFFPYQDLHIDISKMDLSDHHDQVRLEHISFSSAINYSEGLPDPESLIMRSLDETLPYAKYSEEGAIVDYLSPAPMHAILSWMWYDFFEGNEEDGTWQAVSPEFIFHDPEPTTYHPLAKEGKVWNFKMREYLNNGVLDHYYSYIVKGDTTIHEKAYKKLYMQYDKYNIYTAALRDEGSCAYIVPANTGSEFYYYDLELKERVPLTHGLDARPYKSPSTRDINGITLNCLEWLIGPTSVHMLFLWIEGIGCTQDFFKCHLFGPSDGGTVLGGYGELVSCIEDGVYLYGDETSVPVTTRTVIPLHYEGKDGYDGEASNIWLETDGTNITFFLHDVKDVFTLYLNNEPLQIDFTGDMFKSFVPSTLLVNYRLESANEVFSIDINQSIISQLVDGMQAKTYRPFIEEGKVWRTGVTLFPNISFSHLYDYYIQGDTIIDNHACKKLMRSELHYPQNYPEHIDTTYAASLYEEGQRVYVVWPGSSRLELAYDFASPVGSHIDIEGYNIIVTRKEENVAGYYKGRSTYVGLQEELEYTSSESCWIEGVGVALNPLYSLNELLPTGLLQEPLIYCFVNDEVLYHNPDIFDGDIYGITPEGGEVKRQWIDFTHITKPRPKAPARERTANEMNEENLTGEYSAKQLFVNMKILSGPYTVTLKDAAGNEVYHKEVQTSSAIALNTDLTKYPEGTYALIVENSDEQYTATLTLPLDDVAVRDIPASDVHRPSAPRTYYDLSGRRLSTPPAKGIYIRDGKKVVR